MQAAPPFPPPPPPGGTVNFTKDGKDLLFGLGALIVGWTLLRVFNGPVGQLIDKAANILNDLLGSPVAWVLGALVFLLYKFPGLREALYGLTCTTFGLKKDTKIYKCQERNWRNTKTYEAHEEGLGERTEKAKSLTAARENYEKQEEMWEKVKDKKKDGVSSLNAFLEDYKNESLLPESPGREKAIGNVDVLDQRPIEGGGKAPKAWERMIETANNTIKDLEAIQERTIKENNLLSDWKKKLDNATKAKTVMEDGNLSSSVTKRFEGIVEATRIHATTQHVFKTDLAVKQVKRLMSENKGMKEGEFMSWLASNHPDLIADMKGGVVINFGNGLENFSINGRKVKSFSPSGLTKQLLSNLEGNSTLKANFLEMTKVPQMSLSKTLPSYWYKNKLVTGLATKIEKIAFTKTAINRIISSSSDVDASSLSKLLSAFSKDAKE